MDRFQKLRTDPYRMERLKICIQYALVLCSAVIAGGAFPFFLGEETLVSSFYKIISHFTLPFSQCQKIRDIALVILRYSAIDLIVASLLFLGSFSMLHYWISQLMLMFKGFRFGFSTVLLIRLLSVRGINYHFSVIAFGIFVIIALVLLIGLMRYTFFLSAAFLNLKLIMGKIRSDFSLSHIGSMVEHWIKYSALILLCNSIYCIIIFLL